MNRWTYGILSANPDETLNVRHFICKPRWNVERTTFHLGLHYLLKYCKSGNFHEIWYKFRENKILAKISEFTVPYLQVFRIETVKRMQTILKHAMFLSLGAQTV